MELDTLMFITIVLAPLLFLYYLYIKPPGIKDSEKLKSGNETNNSQKSILDERLRTYIKYHLNSKNISLNDSMKFADNLEMSAEDFMKMLNQLEIERIEDEKYSHSILYKK